MSNIESYTGKNVCDNQDDFNVAFDKALKQNNKDAMKKARPWVYVYVTLFMIFFIWALVLAMQTSPGPHRIVHLVIAMVFSPIYVLAYYLGALGEGKGVMMGMSQFY
jgi:bacteriorhodopsin